MVDGSKYFRFNTLIIRIKWGRYLVLWLSACHFEPRRRPSRPLLFLKETCLLQLVISDIEFLEKKYHNYGLCNDRKCRVAQTSVVDVLINQSALAIS